MANISSVRLRELEQAEKRLRELQNMKVAEEFAKELLQNVGVLLATTPFERWPEMAKVAYAYAAKGMPSAARTYREGLPKE